MEDLGCIDGDEDSRCAGFLFRECRKVSSPLVSGLLKTPGVFLGVNLSNHGKELATMRSKVVCSEFITFSQSGKMTPLKCLISILKLLDLGMSSTCAFLDKLFASGRGYSGIQDLLYHERIRANIKNSEYLQISILNMMFDVDDFLMPLRQLVAYLLHPPRDLQTSFRIFIQLEKYFKKIPDAFKEKFVLGSELSRQLYDARVEFLNLLHNLGRKFFLDKPLERDSLHQTQRMLEGSTMLIELIKIHDEVYIIIEEPRFTLIISFLLYHILEFCKATLKAIKSSCANDQGQLHESRFNALSANDGMSATFLKNCVRAICEPLLAHGSYFSRKLVSNLCPIMLQRMKQLTEKEFDVIVETCHHFTSFNVPLDPFD